MSSPDGVHVDPALLELFRAEMDTHIPALSQGLLALEKGRASDQDIAAMMRAAHSIKGAARIVGMEAAVGVAHIMEDCFTAAREARTPLVGAAVDVLLQGVDALQRICAPEPDPELTEAWLADLRERLRAVKDGRLRGGSADRPVPPSIAETQPLTSHSRPADELRLILPTELDDAAAAQLRMQLCAAVAGFMPRIRLDFSQVSGISAGALAVLAILTHEVLRGGLICNVTAEGASGPIAALLRVTGLDRAWTTQSPLSGSALRGPEEPASLRARLGAQDVRPARGGSGNG